MPSDVCKEALDEMHKRSERLPTDCLHVKALLLRTLYHRGIFSDFFDSDLQPLAEHLADHVSVEQVQARLTKTFRVQHLREHVGSEFFVFLGSGTPTVTTTCGNTVTQRTPRPSDSYGLSFKESSDLELKVTASHDDSAYFLRVHANAFVPALNNLLENAIRRSSLQRTLHVLQHAGNEKLADSSAAIVAHTLCRYMRKWSFFSDKSTGEIDMIAYICARTARLVRVAPGDTLFKQGDEIDPDKGFFVILSGAAEVWLEHAQDSVPLEIEDSSDAVAVEEASLVTEEVIGVPTREERRESASSYASDGGDPSQRMCATTLEVGQSFGEIALIESGRRTASIVAAGQHGAPQRHHFANGSAQNLKADSSATQPPNASLVTPLSGSTKALQFAGVESNADSVVGDNALYLCAISKDAYLAAIEAAQNESVQADLRIQKNLQAFKGFSNPHHFEWQHYFRPETLKRGDVIFDQDEPSTMVKFLVSGSCVALHKSDADDDSDEEQSGSLSPLAANAGLESKIPGNGQRVRRRSELSTDARSPPSRRRSSAQPSSKDNTTRWDPMFSFSPGDALGDIAFCRNNPQPFRIQVSSDEATIWTLHDSLLIRERLREPLERVRYFATLLEHCFILSLARRTTAQVDFFASTFTKAYMQHLPLFQTVIESDDRALHKKVLDSFHVTKVRAGDVVAEAGDSCNELSVVVSGQLSLRLTRQQDLTAMSPPRKSGQRPKRNSVGLESPEGLASTPSPPRHSNTGDGAFITEVAEESKAGPSSPLVSQNNQPAASTPTSTNDDDVEPKTVATLCAGATFGDESLNNSIAHFETQVYADTDTWIASIEPRTLRSIVDEFSNAPYRRKFNFFRSMPALSRCSDKAIEAIVSHCEESQWSKGDIIVDCGDPDTSTLFFIAKGQCEVYGPLGREPDAIPVTTRGRSNSESNDSGDANSSTEQNSRQPGNSTKGAQPDTASKSLSTRTRASSVDTAGSLTAQVPSTSSEQPADASASHSESPKRRSNFHDRLAVDALSGAFDSPDLTVGVDGSSALQANLSGSHFTKKWQQYANVQQGDFFGAAAFFHLRPQQTHRVVASGWLEMSGASSRLEQDHHTVHLYAIKIPNKKAVVEQIHGYLRPLKPLAKQRLAWREQQRERVTQVARDMIGESIASCQIHKRSISDAAQYNPARPGTAGAPNGQGGSRRGGAVQRIHVRKRIPKSLKASKAGGRRRQGKRATTATFQHSVRSSGFGVLSHSVPLQAVGARRAAIPSPWTKGQPASRANDQLMVSGQGSQKDSARSSKRVVRSQTSQVVQIRSRAPAQTAATASVNRADSAPLQQLFGDETQSQIGEKRRLQTQENERNREDEREMRRVLALPEIKRSLKQVKWKYRYQW